jgi:RNA ligase (TIGR02306 family)
MTKEAIVERKLATVEKILDVQPIPNADAIERVTVRGWHCVARKNEFKVGDYCVYVEIDSLLPIRPEFEFLRKNCYKQYGTVEGFRIRTQTLRGQVSQGIVFSLSILPMYTVPLQGIDVTDDLGIIKYDPPLPACLSGIALGPYPTFVQKTDEQRIQNYPEFFPDIFERKDIKYYATEKLDGSSGTHYLMNDKFGVCSHNLELVESKDNTFWQVARALDVEAKLRSVKRNIALQGELVGPGIEGNRYKLNKQTIFYFSIFDIDRYKYLQFEEFRLMIAILELPIVPIIEYSYTMPDSIDDILNVGNGISVLNENTLREGLVFRAINEQKHISFKVLSNAYIIKYGK